MKLLFSAKIILYLTFWFLLSSCTTTQKSIDKALVETLVAREVEKTATAENMPTQTPIPTSTAIPTSTSTSTPTVEPILQIIPRDFLCSVKDLPEGGDYVNPHGWSSWETNYIGQIDQYVDKGLDYAYETRRISESWIRFSRRASSAKLPKEIYCGVYTYENSKDAQTALKYYNWVETYKSYSGEIYKYLDNNINIGDQDITYAVYFDISKDYHDTLFVLEYVYKNILVRISGYSPNVETFVKFEHLEKIANNIYLRLEKADLK